MEGVIIRTCNRNHHFRLREFINSTTDFLHVKSLKGKADIGGSRGWTQW